MDKFYDACAGKMLESISADRRDALAVADNVAMKHLSDLEADDMDIVATGNKKNWRLCVRDEEDGQVSDEVIFRAQGIVLKNNLTPKNTVSCPARKVPFICQHIEVCGLDSPTFREAIAKTEEVNERFHEHFSSVTVVDLVRPASSLGPVIAASNRLFTIKTDAPTKQDTDFVDGLDPTGALEKLKHRELIHAPDNMVHYFRFVAVGADSGKVKYEKTVPGTFKAGDIVEIQMSFVAIQAANSEIKVTARLQAVTLLDASFTKAATIARNRARIETKPQQAVRRKIGYFHEDQEEPERAAKKRNVEHKG
ncbi:hypothetical protein C8R47DRAFT_1226694 [Mycena vitilis]|nr:hypothetical protein C8R47DRAFT_1226694 [Mycena vitilis]